MKFIHIADSHIGAWRDHRLRNLNLESFNYVIDQCIKENVDFLIISGDLFNTSVPKISILKKVIRILNKLKERSIPIYIINGSHDYSPSGTSIIEILEETNLVINVTKGKINKNQLDLTPIIDKDNKLFLTGINGKKGSIETEQYVDVNFKTIYSMFNDYKDYYKLFLFHTTIDELLPLNLKQYLHGISVEDLPEGFNYYAGGHIHIIEDKSFENHKNVVYPGPVFPNNFLELEKLKSGSYLLVTVTKENNTFKTTKEIKKIILHQVLNLNITFEKLSAQEIYYLILDKVKVLDVDNKLVLIRLKGLIADGSLKDINLNEITRILYESGAYVVLRNTSKLKKYEPEIEDITLTDESDVEKDILEKNKGKFELFKENEINMSLKLMNALSQPKLHGETNTTYYQRIKDDIDFLLGISKD